MIASDAATSPAWNSTLDAAAAAGVRIVELEALRDADAVNAVIASVWGEQSIGRELLRALQHAGCVLLGARDPDGGLVGYVLGFAGLDGGLHLHSHMLAVLPEWQSRGVGFTLKLAQRAWSLDHGISDIRWTYDPLLLGNARFNLVKLGAVAVRYLPDFYGDMDDEINRGERTDRFELSWMASSARVRTAIQPDSGRPTPVPGDAVDLLIARGDPARPEPFATAGGPWERVLVAVPRDHLALRRTDRDLAGRWRAASGDAFRACFDHGLVATAVTDDGRYLFERSPLDGGSA